MISNSNFLTAVKGQNRQISAQIEGVPDLINLKIETSTAPFGTAMRKITGKAYGVDLALQGRQISPMLSVNTATLQLETFLITEEKINLEAGTTEFEGYDAMLNFNLDYDAERHSFPCSMAHFLEQICGACGVELFETPDLLSLEIPNDIFEKQAPTYREILKQIAEISGGVFFAKNGKLAFSKMSGKSSVATITSSDLKTLTVGETTPAINSLVLSRTPQEDNIYFQDETATAENGTSELKIENNELVDKRRESVAEAIFGRVAGANWRAFKAETFGLAVLEPADTITIDAGGASFETIILDSTLEISSALKETFETAPLTPTLTNYKRATGIWKKLYNTEIIVDKQQQYIESIVEERHEFEEQINEDFSRLKQDLNGFDIQIQKSSGWQNLIKNSAFWSENSTDGALNFWEKSGGTITPHNSAESKAHGGISGRSIAILNGTLRQKVAVVAGETYSFGAKVKKSALGVIAIGIREGNTVLDRVMLNAGTTHIWEDVAIEGFAPTTNEITLEISAVRDDVELSDLIISNSEKKTAWTLANGEIANTGVVIDEKGITVNSSVNEGDTVEITPLEFAGYSRVNGTRKRVFSVNKDTTEVQKLKAEDELFMAPLKIVAVKDGATTGWAFVENSK